MSDALLELENLKAAALHHHQLCDSPDCVTSLRLMKHTATRLLSWVNFDEREQAMAVLEEWPA